MMYDTYFRRTPGQAEDKPDRMVRLTEHTSVNVLHAGIHGSELRSPTHNLTPQEEHTLVYVRPSEREAFIKRRDAVFNDPTPENALTYWNEQGLPEPKTSDVPLATLHKARLQWFGVTDAQITDSMTWLNKHGFLPEMRGIPPLTPESRDAQRAALGMEPLAK